MTVEIRVQSVKPLRHTFGHIARPVDQRDIRLQTA